MGLILTIKENDKIAIGEDITIKYRRRGGNRIRIHFEAPDNIRIKPFKYCEGCDAMARELCDDCTKCEEHCSCLPHFEEPEFKFMGPKQ